MSFMRLLGNFMLARVLVGEFHAGAQALETIRRAGLETIGGQLGA